MPAGCAEIECKNLIQGILCENASNTSDAGQAPPFYAPSTAEMVIQGRVYLNGQKEIGAYHFWSCNMNAANGSLHSPQGDFFKPGADRKGISGRHPHHRKDGAYRLGGTGPAVEYAVKMRRRSMARLLDSGGIRRAQIHSPA
jgi:hypothetical protein